MLNVIKSWFEKYFSDEEAVVVFVLLIVSSLVIINLGSMMAPVIGSIIVAYVLQGLVGKLQRLKIPHIYSVLTVFTVFVGVMLATFLVVMPLIARQVSALVKEMPKMLTNAKEGFELLPEQYPQFVSQELVNDIYSQLTAEVSSATQAALSYSLSSIPAFFTVIIYAVLVPILVFFFLKDKDQLLAGISSVLPTERKLMREIWQESNLQFANYIRGKVLEIFIVGGVTYISFVWLGINYAALLATLVGLSVVIPYIGAALVTIPVTAIGLFQFGWGSEFAWLMIVYGVVQALDGNILVPLLFSEVVNLHPVVIIISVLLFGGLWGLWGVFFAIPLATLLKAIFSAWPTLAHKGV
jgi:putative permease